MKTHMEIHIFYNVCIIVRRTEGFAFANYPRFMSASYYRFRLFTQIKKNRLLFCIMPNQWFLVIWKCSGRHFTHTLIACRSFHTIHAKHPFGSLRICFSFCSLFYISIFRGKKSWMHLAKEIHLNSNKSAHHFVFFFSRKTNSLFFFITQNNLAMNIKTRALEFGKVYGKRLYHQILVTMEPLKICKKYPISLLIGLSFRLL